MLQARPQTIDPLLTALLTKAQQITPQGQPTVAAQVAQAAAQKEQAGIQALMPGVRQQAMEMAQAQQPVTQAQLQQAMAQQQQNKQPVMAARGGIITLPADVEMAEGGIVGYNGTTRSFVSNLTAEELAKMPPEMRKAYFKEMVERRAAAGPTYATPEAASSTRGAASAARGIGSALKRLAPFALMSELFTTPEEDIDLLRQAEATRNAGAVTNTGDEVARLAARFEKPTTPTPQQLEAQVRQAPGTSYQPDASLFRGAVPRPPAAAPAAPASGVASLMGPPVPSGSERQFGEAIAAAGRVAEPEEITPEKLQAQREAIYRARGIDPDFAKARLAGIERLKAMDEAAKAAHEQEKKDIAWENVATRFAAMGGAPTPGAGSRQSQLLMAQRYGEQRKADQQFNQLMRVNEEARIKEINAIDDMNRALAEGDIGRAEKRKAEILELRNTKNFTEAKMRAQYAPQLLEAETAEKRIAAQEREGRLDRESRERIAKWNDATQMAVAQARVEGKNPYDTVLNNVRAEFADWQKSGVGLAADAAARNAMYQEIYARHLKIAKEFGVKVPEGAGRGATGTKENPIKLD